MAEVRPPSARLVKAALREAGFPESVQPGPGSARVTPSPGWRADEPGTEVRVSHWGGLLGSRAGIIAALGRYEKALRSAGFTVQADARMLHLAVTATADGKGGNG